MPTQPDRKMTPLLTAEQAMDIIRTTVPRLEELTRGATQKALTTVTSYGWSVNEQLAHLRSCADVLGGNMLRIVREDHPAFRGVAPTARQKEYFEWKFGPAFEAFRAQRAELLEVLEPLAPGGWERTAAVSAPPGRVWENSVLYYGDWMARHERGHLKHIARVLKDVG